MDIGEPHLPTAADTQAWAQGSCAALPWATDPALECCGAAKLGLKPGEDKPWPFVPVPGTPTALPRVFVTHPHLHVFTVQSQLK